MQPLRTTILVAMLSVTAAATGAPLADVVTHHTADSDGVDIHYVALGDGPLIVLIHGFPDYWYGWRHQMEALAANHRVVAMDQRGYNRSGRPAGQENYDTSFLVRDVAAVIQHAGADQAILAGHDWGGHVAWSTAMMRPELVAGLVIFNLPHPSGFSRELATNPKQKANSEYARRFQQPDAHEGLSPALLADLVAAKDAEARPLYVEAFERSDIEAMLHYYKQNYPKSPYKLLERDFPKIRVPVLQFHGLRDEAIHHHGLNNTWEHVDAPYTLVTIPNAAHWVHHDAPELVNETLRDWLARQR